jgi:hypothetical protein
MTDGDAGNSVLLPPPPPVDAAQNMRSAAYSFIGKSLLSPFA